MLIRIRISFSKEEMKDIEAAAKKAGISVPAFIVRAAVKAARK